jgi:hypothetical protein
MNDGLIQLWQPPDRHRKKYVAANAAENRPVGIGVSLLAHAVGRIGIGHEWVWKRIAVENLAYAFLMLI